MNPCAETFLCLIRSALSAQPAQLPQEPTPEDWKAMAELAAEHKLLPLFAEAAHPFPGAQEPLSPLKRAVRRQVMVQALKTHEFLELYQALDAAGVRPLVVKGILCRSLYPQPDHRSSADEDLLAAPGQFDRTCGVLEELGMTPLPHKPDANEIPYIKKDGSLYIELHRALFPEDAEAYGDWNRFFTGIWDHAVPVNVQGVSLLAPEPTEHLFFLIAHALKHFLHSGFGIRQICDIVLFANAHGRELDWERLTQLCSQLRAVDFTAAIFRIGQDYLTFDPELAHYPQSWRARQVNPVPMLEDLLSGGVYGTASMSRLHSSNITLEAAAASNQGKNTAPSLRSSLFPSAKKLAPAYPYLKERPWLLPLAWCQRIVRYGVETGRSPDNSAMEAVKIGKSRVALLRLYGLLAPEDAGTPPV